MTSQNTIDKTKYKNFPGPKGHFFFGVSEEFQKTPLELNYNSWKEYGDYIKFRAIPGFYWYMFTHPETVQYILQKNYSKFRKPDFFNKSLGALVGNGLIVSEGDSWLRNRRLQQPMFHKKQLINIFSIMVKAVNELILEWEKLNEDNEIDIVSEMMNLTMKIASLTLFSINIGDKTYEAGFAFRDAFSHINYKMNNPMSLPEWIPTERNKNFNNAKKVLDKVVLDIIEKRRNSKEEYNDLLHILMNSKDEETGKGMSEQELRNEVLTLLIAGHETVGASLSWLWYVLGDKPEIKSKLSEEARFVLDGRNPDFNDIQNLEYTKMVYNEVLRLYPPAWGMPRETIEDEIIDGYFVPKKSVITLSQYVTHRHSEFWEKPLEFYPEHFEKDKIEKRHKFAFFPFGGGPRICIGNNFALMEAPLIISMLVQRFKIDLVPGQIIQADPTFTLRPKSEVKVIIRKKGK